MPTCWIIAGPNGAGKTTFAVNYLPQLANCFHFINADLIAAGLNPLAPEKELIAASRIFLNEIKDAISKREDFAFETTLSGRAHLRIIKRLRSQNWQVELIYLALLSSEMSKQRVAERVAHGGHNIPQADIRRRFPRSLSNLFGPYGEAASRVRCFLNENRTPVPVFERKEAEHKVYDESLFNILRSQLS